MDKHHRDDREVRKFVGRTAVRLFIMIVVVVTVFLITQTPVFTNDIAMNQMENSNDWFIAMSMYQKFARVAGILGNASIIVTLGLICWDGYKLAKILNSETKNEKEN